LKSFDPTALAMVSMISAKKGFGLSCIRDIDLGYFVVDLRDGDRERELTSFDVRERIFMRELELI
jgi:hypothetical protein